MRQRRAVDDESLSSSTPQRNGAAASTSTSSSRRQFQNFDLWAASLCLLVCLVLQLELLGYKLFISDNGDDSPAHGVETVLSGGGKEKLMMAVSSDKQQQQKDQPKPPLQLHDKEKEAHKVPIPNKQPTPVKQPTPDLESLLSYEPTKRIKKSRLKKAIGESYKNSFFWKVFEPEKIAPPNSSDDLPPEIAYVTTLTKCGRHRGSIDGAAVLLHSIRRNSYGWIPMQSQSDSVDFDSSLWPKYGGKGGKYRYKAYVIVDPQASPTIKDKHGDCARFMQSIGWTVLHRPPLVPLFEIPTGEASSGQSSASFDELVKAGYIGVQRPNTGDTARRPGEHPNKLRMLMYNDGCCGDTELLKLHTYGLVGHELAVHLDFDSLILRPMDDLFDVMLGKQKDDKVVESLSIAKLPQSKPVDFSRPIDAAFTRDYNSVKSPSPKSPVGYQGGFLIVRPSLTVLERYRKILQRGEFSLNPRKGWGNKHGGFYGDATFQGIVPYYYEDVAPPGEHNELELDRCIYNQMADNPRKSTHKFPRATPLDPQVMGYSDKNKCRDGRKDCRDTDCQRTHPKDSITTHFTFCNKPWDCSSGLPGTVALDTCLGLLSEWYGVRRELEDWWLLPRNEAGEATNDVSFSQRSFYWNQRTIDRVQQKRQGSLQPDVYKGYCDGIGESGYRNMMGPDGLKK
mmetsp:Transcript_11307/g.22577  ORF Transcript_11307/g.22577 Transcript_11307/m.22577 type:complete len:680 (-) Transcript_11307:88-2127(-)